MKKKEKDYDKLAKRYFNRPFNQLSLLEKASLYLVFEENNKSNSSLVERASLSLVDSEDEDIDNKGSLIERAIGVSYRRKVKTRRNHFIK